MKNTKIIFFLAILLLACAAINSCKKDDKSSVNTTLTTGNWQLGSILVYHYLGSSLTSTDTMNTTCDTTQVFTFNNDGTCTYTNYHCVPQPTAKGTWIITGDKLFLEYHLPGYACRRHYRSTHPCFCIYQDHKPGPIFHDLANRQRWRLLHCNNKANHIPIRFCT
jgi:hypothetical protein